jgi:hypothetical protein
MRATEYQTGSGLAVPGIEAVFEYGDSAEVARDRIPGAMQINDRSQLEYARVENVSGLQADPDQVETRQKNSDIHGERVGLTLYSGRTIGVDGKIVAGTIPAMRDVWSRFRGQFGTTERDLLIHPPNEVATYVNEIHNPDPQDAAAYGWSGFADGAITVAGGQGFGTAGLIDITGGVVQGDGSVGRAITGSWVWDGEDVWITALVKLVSATSSVDSIAIYMTEYPGGPEVQKDEVGNPAVGDWTKLAIRILASDIRLTTSQIAFMIRIDAPSGDYQVQFGRAALVKLLPEQATPDGFLGAQMAGFEPDGVRGLSRSYGPCYAVNQILDVDSSYVDNSGVLLHWGLDSASFATNQSPIPVRAWRGQHTGAGYAKITKDNNATSRTGSVVPGVYFEVAGGRTYRWAIRVRCLQKPVTGTLSIGIRWLSPDFLPVSVISTSYSATVVDVGEDTYVVEATAPPTAYMALPVIALRATTTALGVLEVMWADPFFADVSDHDPGEFYGLEQYESAHSPETFIGPRRRIPRPFLLRGAKIVDARAPDLQGGPNARRDFTMSIRASDPRTYTLDSRHKQLQLTGTPKLVTRSAPDDFTLDTATLPTPTGYTSEGSFVTHPAGGTLYTWSQDLTVVGVGYAKPLKGVGIRAYDVGGAFGANGPTQALITRYYRSAEAFTYTSPRVILGGAPQSFGFGGAPPFDLMGFRYRSTGSVGSKTFYVNKLTALLKRHSSTEWIELRWSSSSKAHADNSSSGTPEPNAPYAFELWSSHDATGTLATTRLQTWDYASYDSSSGVYPFRPSRDPMWLVAYMLSNVVHWELWTNYPSPIDTSGLLESGSYAIPSGLQAVIGTGVAGSSGWGHTIMTDGATGPAGVFQDLAGVPPFTHYYESSDASLPAKTTTVPVIGSIDTPQKIEVRGDVVDPIVSISTPSFDGKPSRTSVARFTGTIPEANPVTIDLADGSVRDSFGNNRRDLLVPGYEFAPYRPGINFVSMQAKSWSTSVPTHLVTSWRDAEK